MTLVEYKEMVDFYLEETELENLFNLVESLVPTQNEHHGFRNAKYDLMEEGFNLGISPQLAADTIYLAALSAFEGILGPLFHNEKKH